MLLQNHKGNFGQVAPKWCMKFHSFTCSLLLGCAPKVLSVSNQKNAILRFQSVQIIIELLAKSVTAVLISASMLLTCKSLSSQLLVSVGYCQVRASAYSSRSLLDLQRICLATQHVVCCHHGCCMQMTLANPLAWMGHVQTTVATHTHMKNMTSACVKIWQNQVYVNKLVVNHQHYRPC